MNEEGTKYFLLLLYRRANNAQDVELITVVDTAVWFMESWAFSGFTPWLVGLFWEQRSDSLHPPWIQLSSLNIDWSLVWPSQHWGRTCNHSRYSSSTPTPVWMRLLKYVYTCIITHRLQCSTVQLHSHMRTAQLSTSTLALTHTHSIFFLGKWYPLWFHNIRWINRLIGEASSSYAGTGLKKGKLCMSGIVCVGGLYQCSPPWQEIQALTVGWHIQHGTQWS